MISANANNLTQEDNMSYMSRLAIIVITFKVYGHMDRARAAGLDPHAVISHKAQAKHHQGANSIEKFLLEVLKRLLIVHT